MRVEEWSERMDGAFEIPEIASEKRAAALAQIRAEAAAAGVEDIDALGAPVDGCSRRRPRVLRLGVAACVLVAVMVCGGAFAATGIMQQQARTVFEQQLAELDTLIAADEEALDALGTFGSEDEGVSGSSGTGFATEYSSVSDELLEYRYEQLKQLREEYDAVLANPNATREEYEQATRELSAAIEAVNAEYERLLQEGDLDDAQEEIG